LTDPQPQEHTPPARGRNAPPPEVRLPLQRQRLLRAAAAEFATYGFSGTGSESISRRAGMSKATFYEHFANKEECMIALFDRAVEVVGEGIAQAARDVGRLDAPERIRAATRAFLRSPSTPSSRRHCSSRSSAPAPAPRSTATR
jgi:AcrR family transcriptional regulator